MRFSYPIPFNLNFRLFLMLLAALTLSACSSDSEDFFKQQATVDLEILQTLPEQNISYIDEVAPVLGRRCVVCHGCYDAPCQLKLSSPEGILRGASPELVYNGARFGTMSPTRLYVDARGSEEWRAKGFHSVLNEGSTTDRQSNLENSVMYKMLRLKQLNPQARAGMLHPKFDLSLGRKQTCTVQEDFDDYAKKFPNQGMPFGMPNMDDAEYRTVVQWLAQGSPMPALPGASEIAAKQIVEWERFLNGSSNKQRLVSRYLYEHLFSGHMQFEGTDKREFYRLVRSSTAPGQAVEEIATVRPYDDPGDVVYYRLLRYPAQIVAKSHQVYQLSAARLKRLNTIFLKPEYQVAQLPSREPQIASNPFKAYRDIPARSRYQFLLDDAAFFIEGFIKGPVCRGMIALNVIEDRFWVTFVSPDSDETVKDPDFLDQMASYLELPSSQGGNVKLLGAWKEYLKLEKKYTQARFEHFNANDKVYPLEESTNYLWDGDGHNPNAALTIYRHFDSASVDKGLQGDFPETAWVIDYPLLERIHYLLVAGYNVFGNLKHQLNTRLYMDFLRMEGEDMFLAFLPSKERKEIISDWYKGMREGRMDQLSDGGKWMDKDVVVGYQTDDPQRELYQQIIKYMSPVNDVEDVINRCGTHPCFAEDASADKRVADSAMSVISGIKGQVLIAFPDVAFVRVMLGGEPADDLAYTIVRDKAYKNVTSIFGDESDNLQRDFENDALTVLDHLEGSYPNFFFDVALEDVAIFAERYAGLQDRQDYEKFVAVYGVRRTNPQFWETADWFQDAYLRQEPSSAGLFDLNRYINR